MTPQGAKPPSAAALRAARKWYPGEPEPTELAEVIDRETCLPELVEALKDMSVAFNLAMFHGQIGSGTENSAIADAAVVALRLAEQGREGR